MPHFNGPYTIMAVDEEHSTVTLDLPNSPNIFPTFHTLNVVPYVKNNSSLFPECEFAQPPPVIMENSESEYFIRDIINKRRVGHGYRYLVHWKGYGPEENCWLPTSKLKDTKALDIWLAKKRVS